ncbi:MAG: uracil-DNA glycosylase [Magnetococcales bacterium]|nr:uracil-DNA glycosylase [Magnetococcales bacterium]
MNHHSPELDHDLAALLLYWRTCGIDLSSGSRCLNEWPESYWRGDFRPVSITSVAAIPAPAAPPDPIVLPVPVAVPPPAIPLAQLPACTDPVAQMNQIAEEVRHCHACQLAHTRTQTVLGVGDLQASIALVGEGPGADEDRQGEPFVGAAGQLLNKMLAAIGTSRQQVYIANVVKCRPPGNRNPLPEEMAACQNYLFRQLEIVRPRLIVALGRFAILCLLGRDQPVGSMRGKRESWRGVPVIATYHPAFYLRQPSRKRDAWADLLLVLETLEQHSDAPERQTPEQTEPR